MDLRIQRNQRDIVIMLFLTMLIFAVYWQVMNFSFVDYDDNIYIFNNHFITQGFSYGNIIWAFTSTYVGHWHPLTWLSLILDYKLFGLNAGGYHWTNVILHIINALLLFKLLQWITAETGKSVLVALLFALHPLNVESVAWISERKNVLSMLFFLSTISSYVYYVRCPNSYKYTLIIFCFIAG
jgi:protein O-mannosyl-transferase